MLTVGIMLCHVWGIGARIDQRSDSVVKGSSNVAEDVKQRLGLPGRVTMKHHGMSFVRQTKCKLPETAKARRSVWPWDLRTTAARAKLTAHATNYYMPCIVCRVSSHVSILRPKVCWLGIEKWCQTSSALTVSHDIANCGRYKATESCTHMCCQCQAWRVYHVI